MTDRYVEELDETLENTIEKIKEMDMTDPATGKVIDNLKILNDVRTNVYTVQQASYEFECKTQADEEKTKSEKRNNIITHVENCVMTFITGIGSVVIPLTILNKNQMGDYFDKGALASTMKVPLLKLTKIFTKK